MVDEFIVLSATLKLGYGLVALLALYVFLRVAQRRSGIDRRRFMAGLDRSPLAAAFYQGLVAIAAALLIGLVIGCTPANAATFPTEHDRAIERAVKTWWPDYPVWRAWKAQLWQESRFKADAVSPAGARGLAQFLPATWDRVLKDMNRPWVPPSDAATAIEAGAYFMAILRRQWAGRPRPPPARHALAQASYNAGLGNILRAQTACADALLWPAIAPCLPAITGRHAAKETIDYVHLIARWQAMMEAGL